MEMTNDSLGCSRATQVHMEYLRLVNLTEICPSRRVGHFKAPCKCSGWRKLESTIKQKLLMMKNLQILFDATTKLSQIVPTRVIETGALNR